MAHNKQQAVNIMYISASLAVAVASYLLPKKSINATSHSL